MLLELHNISKIYDTRIIFRDVTLTVDAATITLLVGANGAGKSTLMRIMAGLGQATAGRVALHVESAKLGYLGHATFLYPALTALENLLFWRDIYAVSATMQDLTAILERVGLARRAHERAGIFSRGMAQRLNLARILLMEPDLLLLDEPGTGLDAASADLLRQEIVNARERGAGVVWISHDLNRDLSLADRVATLEDRHLACTLPVERGGALC